MILDSLIYTEQYLALHPGFDAAFRYLRESPLESLSPGRHPIEGERLFAIAASETGRGRGGARLEVHQQYIDIQYIAAGEDLMGWSPLPACAASSLGYDAARDIEFFMAAPRTWLTVHEGSFAIFFPSDAHAPLAGETPLSKVVLKVAVNWS